VYGALNLTKDGWGLVGIKDVPFSHLLTLLLQGWISDVAMLALGDMNVYREFETCPSTQHDPVLTVED
jgi:hypothetical protein